MLSIFTASYWRTLLTIEDQLQGLAKNMSKQQDTIDAITTELGTVKASLTATQTDVQALGTGITNLESTVATLNAEIATLQAQIAGGSVPTVDLTALQTAADALNAQVADLKTSADDAVSKLPK